MMSCIRPPRIAILALVALLMSTSAWALCGACQAAPAVERPGCHEAPPAVQPDCCDGGAVGPAEDCCGQLTEATPVATERSSARLAAAATCLAVAFTEAESIHRDSLPVRLSSPEENPPPLHTDIGLYTLHAVFLI